jgi:phospholipid transport system substrate-binding protein
MEYFSQSNQSKFPSCPAVARAVLFCLLLSACASPPAEKDPFPEPLPPDVAQARDVVLRVEESVREVAQQSSTLGYEERRVALAEIGLRNFDLPRMAELSYGPSFRELTPDQKRLWVDTFIAFRSSASAKVNSRDRGRVSRLTGYEQISKGVVLIRTVARYPRQVLEISVDYRLAEVGGEWKIVDRYSPSTVSEIAMRRSEYRTILEKEGFDGLIEDIDRRIEGYMAR